MMSEPSFQEASFSPQRHGKFQMIQPQAGTGTASNGFGNAQVVTTAANGWKTGTSEGYKIVLLHPDANGILTVPNVTLLASATNGPGQHYMPSWQYYVRTLNFTMTRNSVDVTSPAKPATPVMVGERNDMSVSVSGLPTGLIPTYQWTIPGTRIKDFIEITGNQTVTPKIPYSGQKVDLPPADLLTQSPHFYWYSGTFTGQVIQVSVVVNIAGNPVTVKGDFKVHRPQMGTYTGVYTSQNPPISLSTSYTTINEQPVLVDFLGLGTVAPGGSKGITYTATVSTPNLPIAAGEIAYEQLVTANSETKIVDIGHVGVQVTDALDSLYPKPQASPRYSGSDPIAAGVTNQTIIRDDTPGAIGNNLGTDGDFYKQDSQFKTFLMYKPSSASSIWVPLGIMNWSVKFTVTYNSALNPPYTFTDLLPTRKADGSAPSNIVGTLSATLPQYTQRIQDNLGVPLP